MKWGRRVLWERASLSERGRGLLWVPEWTSWSSMSRYWCRARPGCECTARQHSDVPEPAVYAQCGGTSPTVSRITAASACSERILPRA